MLISSINQNDDTENITVTLVNNNLRDSTPLCNLCSPKDT